MLAELQMMSFQIRSVSPQLAFAATLSVMCLAGIAPNASGQVPSGTGEPRASIYRSQVFLYARDHGVALDVAAERLEWQRLSSDLQDKARRRLGPAFGGVWIDNEDNGRVKLGLARSNPALIAEARAITADSGLSNAVDIVPVPHSEAELNEISHWLNLRIDQANAGADWPIAVGTEPDRSVVHISLPRYEQRLTQVQQNLINQAKQLYGSAITLGTYNQKMKLLACGYPYCEAPLRGGIMVGPTAAFNPPEPGGVCTGAFLARGKAPDNTLYQLTAGHCAFNETWGTQLSPTGPVEAIGPWKNEEFGESGDAGIYEIANDSLWNARPWIYWAGTSEGYPIFSDANPVKGQGICVSGAAYGESNCGTVTQLNLTVEVGGTTLKGMIRANFCAGPGDSGAPLHYYGVSYGILSGGSEGECDTFSTPILTAEELMGIDVRHESECDPLFESPVKTGDMTGDGKEDIFQFTADAEGKTYAWESKGSSYTGLGSIGTGFGSQYQNRVGDMDGDGDDDLFQMTDNGDLYAWESKGTSYTYLGKVASGFGSACDTRVANINGDSEIDVLRFTNDGYAYGWLANEGEYEALGQIGTGFGSTYQDRSGDMDGDGDDDLFQILDNGTVYRWTSNGSSYTPTGEPFSGVGNASQVRFADTEGDGDDDIFRFTDAGVASLWKSKGTAYEAIGTIATGLGVTRQMRVADIDGDEDADILKFADDGNGYAWKFNGSTYESIGKIGSGFGAP